MRSIYFVSDREKLAKKKLESIYLKGMEEGKRIGKMIELKLPKETGTLVLKFGVSELVKLYAPDMKRLEIEEKALIDFLKKEGAKKNSWIVRFWDLGGGKKKFSRTITAGRETLDIHEIVGKALDEKGRTYEWAGVTFSHPDLGVRTQIYRYPTASIYPERIKDTDKNYQKIKERFEIFLNEILAKS